MKVSVKFLQVGCGDAIVISYEKDKIKNNIVIDGGHLKHFPAILEPILTKLKGNINPWIITHLDRDHINGMVEFTRSGSPDTLKKLKNVWFNCFSKFRIQLKNKNVSLEDGIKLKKYLKNINCKLKDEIKTGFSWKDENGLVTIDVLSPDIATYKELGYKWKKEEQAFYQKLRNKNISRKKSNDYSSLIKTFVGTKLPNEKKSDLANKSSIAFLLNIGGKKILFLGDAHPSVYIKSLRGLMNKNNRKPIKVDYAKLSHHGSKYNYKQDLHGVIECDNFIISADSSNGYFLPDKATLAKILLYPRRDTNKEIKFHFNHSNNAIKSIFAIDSRKEKKLLNFKCLYPKNGKKYYELKWKYNEKQSI